MESLFLLPLAGLPLLCWLEYTDLRDRRAHQARVLARLRRYCVPRFWGAM